MKKILSLTLIFIMMISAFAFTSCDNPYGQAQSFLQEQLEDWGIIARNTITKDEWIKTLDSKNYTVELLLGGQSEKISKTETKYYKEYINTDGISESIYFEIVNDVGYIIAQQDGKWYSIEWDDPAYRKLTLEITIANLLNYDSYDEFVYDKSKKAYIFSGEKCNAELQFENGVLVYGKLEYLGLNATLIVTDVGTTDIVIPEYTPYDGAGGMGSTGR